jgi:uncharacterized protein Veg
MAKVTENLKTIVKAIDNREVSINQLANELGKTTNAVRSTVSVKDYKEFFIINDKNVVDGKIVKLYKLSQKGLDLLTNNEQESK